MFIQLCKKFVCALFNTLNNICCCCAFKLLYSFINVYCLQLIAFKLIAFKLICCCIIFTTLLFVCTILYSTVYTTLSNFVCLFVCLTLLTLLLYNKLSIIYYKCFLRYPGIVRYYCITAILGTVHDLRRKNPALNLFDHHWIGSL